MSNATLAIATQPQTQPIAGAPKSDASGDAFALLLAALASSILPVPLPAAPVNKAAVPGAKPEGEIPAQGTPLESKLAVQGAPVPLPVVTPASSGLAGAQQVPGNPPQAASIAQPAVTPLEHGTGNNNAAPQQAIPAPAAAGMPGPTPGSSGMPAQPQPGAAVHPLPAAAMAAGQTAAGISGEAAAAMAAGQTAAGISDEAAAAISGQQAVLPEVNAADVIQKPPSSLSYAMQNARQAENAGLTAAVSGQALPQKPAGQAGRSTVMAAEGRQVAATAAGPVEASPAKPATTPTLTESRAGEMPPTPVVKGEGTPAALPTLQPDPPEALRRVEILARTAGAETTPHRPPVTMATEQPPPAHAVTGLADSAEALREVSHREVFQQLVDRVRFMLEEGRSTLAVRLKPEYLGRVELRVSTANGLLNVQLLAENPQVGKALEAGLPQLRQQMEAHGLQLHHVDVGLGGGQQDGGGQAGAWQGNRFSRRWAEAVPYRETRENTFQAGETRWNRVDLLA